VRKYINATIIDLAANPNHNPNPSVNLFKVYEKLSHFIHTVCNNHICLNRCEIQPRHIHILLICLGIPLISVALGGRTTHS
jgi:hypothetical protein